jgi:hypothetical protein
MTRPLIFVATPCYGGQVHQSYMQSIIGLMQHARGSFFDVTLAMLGNDSLITRSRNTLVSAFLDMPQATHLLFVDADISFDPKQVERMLRFGEDVVAGVYPLKVLDWEHVRVTGQRGSAGGEEAALRYCGTPCEADEAESREGFITGVHAGTGFMLIARTAIERVIAAYPELHYTGMLVYPPTRGNRSYHAVFDCMIDPDTGTYLSEDYAFCWRWRRTGGKLWLDTTGRLTHTGVHDFRGNPAPRYAAMLQP